MNRTHSNWIYVIVFIILHLGSHLSLLAYHNSSVSDYYLPTALAVLLLNWLGLRYVLPVVFINAVCTSYFWGNPVENWPLWFLFAIPETLYPLLSWFLFNKLNRGKFWLPDVNHLLLFMVPELQELKHKSLSKKDIIQLSVVFVSLLLIVFLFGFVQFWYLYGVFPLYIAIRCGFGPAIIINFYLLFLVYILPRFFYTFGLNEVNNYQDAIHIFLGANFVFVFAAVTGRVLDDLNEAKEMLQRKNQSLNTTVEELEKTNYELDHFIYSVSHDLSAPLKSIQGLVNISRLSKSHSDHQSYFDQISKSVKKLETFIAEVMDYATNKRQSVFPEEILIKDLCSEIVDNLPQVNNEHPVQIEYLLGVSSLHQDKTRLRIVLNNIFVNALQYQKSIPDHQPVLKITTLHINDFFRIEITDNGEGIAEDVMAHIFEMFYRGNLKSKGSGLGLYIAKHAVEKMKGRIGIQSVFGEGTTVTIDLPDLAK